MLPRILTQLVLVLLTTPLLLAQNQLTPLDIAKIKSVNWFEISADGQYAVYGVSNPADPLKENKSPDTHMHLLDIANNQSIGLITDKSVSAAAFRPGTDKITFLSSNKDKKVTALYQVARIGGDPTELFAYDRSIRRYQWSHDGNKLAFTVADEKNQSDAPYQPIIFEENLPFTRAYVVDLNTGDTRQVSVEGSVYALAWSPDDSKIAVSTSPTPLVDDFYVNQQVSIVDANSMKAMGQIEHQAKLGSFAWSPDGSQLVMIAGANINDPIEGRLFIVSGNGGKPQPILEDFKGMFHRAQWTQKNNIQLLASVGTQSKLLSLNPSSGRVKEIMNASEGSPVWSDFRAAGNNTVFTASNYNHPRELFVSSKGETRRATDSNPWLTDKYFGEQKVVRYKARDGKEIEGILILPNQSASDARLPLITIVHGGPESHYDNSWLTSYSMAGHLGAGQGYAVFYPNYRGSTGRGLEYTMSSQGDQGGKEFDDVVDGVDYLIESGLVDKDRVGVTGGSYGGYATGWLSTKYSDRFAAGVMFVGISNHISKWGTSDIPEEMYNVHARTRVWDDYEYWLKRSPVYYADQAKTPLLIMHGKEDPRVHPGQSMELYRHIKTRTDTPVRLVLYPGEGHGNRKATARLDYNLRMLRWFDYYLRDVKSDLDTEIELER